MVRQACPAIADDAPSGQIDHWRELMSTAVVVRSMLGISPSTYEDACAVMGQENAAVIVACIITKTRTGQTRRQAAHRARLKH